MGKDTTAPAIQRGPTNIRPTPGARPGGQGSKLLPALANAIQLWAESRTAPTVTKRGETLHDKQKAVAEFFLYVGKSPEAVISPDVVLWRKQMEEDALSANTVYTRISHLSSFYEWALRDPALSQHIRNNPVPLARPRRPPQYQTESTKAFKYEELYGLLEQVEKAAAAGSLVAKRDLAILLIYLLTGLRRNEVITMRGKSVEVTDEGLIISNRQKGGKYRGRELRDAETRDALLAYLTAAKRRSVLGSDAPLWTRHDKAGPPGAQLTSHAFDRNFKRYAKAAGIKDARLHRMRHTFARIVGETTGSMTEIQEALDHENLHTTRVYVQRVLVKRDKHSKNVADRLRSNRKSTSAGE